MPTLHEQTRAPTFYTSEKDPVKLTALLYLKEALIKERYEQCPQFIALAREFGAQNPEIDELIEDPRRMPQ